MVSCSGYCMRRCLEMVFDNGLASWRIERLGKKTNDFRNKIACCVAMEHCMYLFSTTGPLCTLIIINWHLTPLSLNCRQSRFGPASRRCFKPTMQYIIPQHCHDSDIDLWNNMLRRASIQRPVKASSKLLHNQWLHHTEKWVTYTRRRHPF